MYADMLKRVEPLRNELSSLENAATGSFYSYYSEICAALENGSIHTVRKSRNITGQNRSPFFLNGANNEVKHYGKRFMGVLLGAGLTGHGHPTCFARKGLPF